MKIALRTVKHRKNYMQSCKPIVYTFRSVFRISKRAPTPSLFEGEQRAIVFVTSVEQYCSSCKFDIGTGTQYSTNLEDPNLLPYAVKCDKLSFSLTRLSLRFNFRSPEESSNDKTYWYSATTSCAFWKVLQPLYFPLLNLLHIPHESNN